MDSFHSTNIEDDYPGYTTIQQNIIDLLDPADMEYYLNDKSLAPLRKVPVCIAAAVYRMSAGNCMPYTTGNNDKTEDQNLLSFNAYQRNESPWSNYRQRSIHHHHHHKTNNKTVGNEDTSSSSSSCSTLEESTCSSRSDSPEPKHRSNKKRSYHMLLREIRRLRGENAFLRSSVSVLKNDLRDCTVSRQNADVIHQRTYEEFENRHVKLEEELLSGQDEIKELKDQIEQLQLASSSSCNGSCNTMTTSSPFSSNNSNCGLTLHDAAYFKRKTSNVFGCYEFEEDDESMDCQPVAHESALPEVDIKMDHLKADDDGDDEKQQQVNDYFTRRFGNEMTTSPQEQGNDDDEEEEEEEDELEPFEQVATSYIHQAIVAKLSSARVRLEFDDLILKYEPTTDAIIAVLAESFVNWIKSVLQKKTTADPISKIFHTKIQAGIHEFWESILQCYTTEDDYQVQLLNHIEDELENKQPPPPQQQQENNTIIDHFDRLALMLYKYSVVDDAAITAWWQNPFNNDISKKIRTVTSKFYDWVQDEEEDEDEEESDQKEDQEQEDGDEDQVYSDDEHTGFSFTDSPIPELNEEDDTFEFAHETVKTFTPTHQQNIEALLTSKDRDPCICQFTDNDTTTAKKDTALPSSSSVSYKHVCSCDSTYTPLSEQSPATEKKKKSVRICDVHIQ